MQCVRAMLGSRSQQCSSHEDAICFVDPLSSEDVAVVVDFHWFTDCHLEAIFNMNTSRLKMFDWLPAFLTEPGSARYSSAPSITTVWSNYQTSYNDFFEVYISNTMTLSPKCLNGAFTSLTFSMSITWPIIFRSYWSIAFSWSIPLR